MLLILVLSFSHQWQFPKVSKASKSLVVLNVTCMLLLKLRKCRKNKLLKMNRSNSLCANNHFVLELLL